MGGDEWLIFTSLMVVAALVQSHADQLFKNPFSSLKSDRMVA